MSEATLPRRGAGAIVFREKPSGGAARTPPWVLGNPSLHRRIVIFIHGYNNRHDVACSGYRAMHRALWANETRPVVDQIFWLFWPGDTAGGTALSAMTYALQVPKARDLAAHLDQWLRQVRASNAQGYPQEVVFVGHSLGCRLTLEAVERLSWPAAAGPSGVPRPAPPRVAGIVLMAAAVPSAYCSGTERFGAMLLNRLQTAAGGRVPIERVMCSGWDHVLRFAFPPGQALARESASQAVGLGGRPGARWSKPNPVRFSHGHGHYWGGAGPIAEVKNVVSAVRPEHEIAAEDLPEWDLPRGEPLAESRLPTNNVGDLCAPTHGAYLG